MRALPALLSCDSIIAASLGNECMYILYVSNPPALPCLLYAAVDYLGIIDNRWIKCLKVYTFCAGVFPHGISSSLPQLSLQLYSLSILLGEHHLCFCICAMSIEIFSCFRNTASIFLLAGVVRKVLYYS